MVKIYWVVSKTWGRCFFKLTQESAQYECDFRMNPENYKNFGKPSPKGSYWVEEEEVDESQFGYCINGLPDMPRPSPVIPDKSDCSVGMVRKLRNGVENDDGTCQTCPYFIKDREEAIEYIRKRDK